MDSSFKIMSKFEIKEHWSVRLTSQKSCFTSRDMFVGRAFQFGFLPSKPCFLLLESTMEFTLYRGQNNV